MQQLLLAIAPQPAPTLENFVAGRNDELVATLRQFAAGNAGERFIYLWGEAGSGKSHLLAACRAAAQEHGFKPFLGHAANTWDGGSPALLDDVERLDEAGQIDLFNLYNRLRDEGGSLLASGTTPPAQLAVRPDLATRLGWGLVFRVHSLNDEEKSAALEAHAQQRGFALPPEISAYLLRHWRRDLPSLIAALDALDRHSLERQRPVSVPLLREVLAHADTNR
ncbi:MAG: DnaA regulatory inactivator Hda [Sulfuricella sp.]|nr:DnaA regulatory inactivator Hda [Sulfuricella sp.]